MKKVTPFKRLEKVNKKNITKIRLVGKDAEISYNKKTFVGRIRNETKNTLEINTESGIKKIPKDQMMIQIELEDQQIIIDGKQLKGRHEDRIKHRMKRKW
jgi:RNase P/RNase MRP subunit p29